MGKNKRGLEIEVTADTFQLTRKLDAIARHAKELAAELKSIDKEDGLSLNELLDKITDENRHGDVTVGEGEE